MPLLMRLNRTLAQEVFGGCGWKIKKWQKKLYMGEVSENHADYVRGFINENLLKKIPKSLKEMLE